MAIAELPFFVELIFVILPITIAILLFVRMLSIIRDIISRYKTKQSFSARNFGQLILFVLFFSVIINLILYMVGDQPSSFSVFEFLVLDMLPITWYTIILYGILVSVEQFTRTRKQAKEGNE